MGYEIYHITASTYMQIVENIVGGVSSNPNESFNAMLASKSPKSKLYGTSISYNLRVGLTLLKKNEGEKFIIDLMINFQVSPSKKLRKNIYIFIIYLILFSWLLLMKKQNRSLFISIWRLGVYLLIVIFFK